MLGSREWRSLAREANVELMTHPIITAERTFLLSPEFEHQMGHVALKSYVDLCSKVGVTHYASSDHSN